MITTRIELLPSFASFCSKQAFDLRLNLSLNLRLYLRCVLHKFFIKTPWWARTIFSAYTWRMPSHEKTVYLTFDDGPHPHITAWVLSELRKHNAKATFFCIGDNVLKYPETFTQILAEGHSVGNHTQHHLNGWKTDATTYLKDAATAAKIIRSNLFRPPYGKIRFKQARGLNEALKTAHARVIMWDVLSADFDRNTSANQCKKNVIKNVSPGSIVVFHDSEKAFRNLETVLPEILIRLKEAGYKFGKIQMQSP